MTTLINLIWCAVTTYLDQALCRLYPIARLRRDNEALTRDRFAALTTSLHEAHQHNAQLQRSISRYLLESEAMICETEKLERRNAYLEAGACHRREVLAASMLRLAVDLSTLPTRKMTVRDKVGAP